MNLLHVIPSFAPAWRYGGPIHAALGMTRELVRQGHAVTVMTTNIDGPGVSDVPVACPVDLDGVEVWYFPIERPRPWYYSRPLSHALHTQISRFDMVHIHSIFLWPTTAAAFWCQRLRVPYIVRPAGSLDPICLKRSYDRWWSAAGSRIKKYGYLHTVGRMDLQYASALHFTSQAEKEAVQPLRLKPPGFVVPLGVDVDEAYAPAPAAQSGLRERYPELRGKMIVLFLSRLDAIKGLDLLIPALGDVASRRQDFAFVVAGSGSQAYQAEVARLVRQHGLEERTLFLGLVEGPEKWSLLREADFLVLPSYHENFGVVVVEAMAAGLPVIISQAVNIWQEVSQAGAGLATTLDTQAIAAAVEHLLSHPLLRQSMGHNGRQLVQEKFTWQNVVKDTLHMYTQVIAGSLPHAPALQ